MTSTDLSSRAVYRLQHDFRDDFPSPLGAWYHPQTNPLGPINIGTAENSILSDKLIKDIEARFKLTPAHLKYRDALIRSESATTVDALPVFLQRSLRPLEPITSDCTVPGPGIGALLAHLIWSLCDEGDGVLLSTPFYTDYVRDIVYPGRAKLVLAHVPANVDSLSVEAMEYVADAIEKSNTSGVRVKILLVCNPHNPLGRAYPEITLRKYAELAESYDAHLVVDEVFANQVFASAYVPRPIPFVSILALADLGVPRDRVHVLAGPTKDFGASGLKVAALVSRNVHLLRLMRAGLSAFPISSASDAALAPLLLDEKWCSAYLDENRHALREAFETAARWCVVHSIPFEPSSAGVFFVVDFESLLKDMGITVGERLEAARVSMIKAGIFMRPTTGSMDPKQYRFRFVFTQPRDTLLLALSRLEQALGLSTLS